MEYMSVSEITDIISDRIDGDPYLTDVGVVGEVSDVRKRGGHLFFNLTDGSSRLPCVIFGWGANVNLEIGEMVRVIGSVRVYRPGGYYSFNVSSIEKVGRFGDRFEIFKKTLERLYSEGILPREKRELDKIPLRIGLITSRDSAALRDVLGVFERNDVRAKVFLFHTRVQGEDAVGEIVSAVEKSKDYDLDVLMIVRGGGSKDDLWIFNDYEVVRSIADLPFPIVSGIGHSIDSVILEKAVDYNMITPTAAAQLVSDVFKKKMEEFEELFNRIKDAVVGRIRTLESELEHLERRLESVSYESTLKRGFVVVERDGKIVRSSRRVDVGDELTLSFSDGRVKVIVVEAGRDD